MCGNVRQKQPCIVDTGSKLTERETQLFTIRSQLLLASKRELSSPAEV